MAREPTKEEPEVKTEARILLDRAKEVGVSNHSQAIELARQALKVAREQDDFSAATGAIDILIASDQLENRMTEESVSYATRALAHAKQTGDKRRQAQALNVLWSLARLAGDYEGEEDYSLEMLELARTMDEPVYRSIAHGNLAIMYRDRGRFEKALEHQEESLDVTLRHLEDPAALGVAYMNLGLIHVDLGDWDKALEDYFRAVAEEEKVGDDIGIARFYNNIAEVYMRRGKLDRARFYLEQAHAVGERHPASILYSEVLGTLGEAALADGDLVTARRCLEQDEEVCRQQGFRAELAETLRRRAEMDIAQRHAESAPGRLEEALTLCRDARDLREEANVLRVMGELQMSLGETDYALEPLARSAELLRASGMARGYELACSLFSLGRLLSETGKDGEAELAEAIDVFERLGVVHKAEQAKVVLDASRQPADVLADKYRDIVGADTTLRDIFETLEKVAATDVTVLVLGESGTGKELVAHKVHDMSKRREGPFVTINCGAVPENLLEVELFGIEKGTATGVDARAGKFENADGGTFFLDEIGDMSPALQSRLLRVLQDKTFERVGASRPTTVDVRIVAATHRDLEQEIAEGRFREDLYYRLNVVSVNLPPLRERRSDIPALAEFYVDRYSREYAKQVTGVSDDCLQCLSAYDWPGNVREFKHVLERGLLMTQGDRITAADIPAGIRAAAS